MKHLNETMKSGIRNRSRRKGKSSEKKALLANPSPPPSPSVWGVQDGVGLYQTRVSSFEPSPSRSRSPSSSRSRSSRRVEAPAPHASSTSSSALPPENRFHPQHEPRKGQPPEHLIGTAAMQFVPAYHESTAATTYTTYTTYKATHKTKMTTTATATATATATRANRSTPSPTKKKPASTATSTPSPKSNARGQQMREDPPPDWDAVIEADDASLRSKASLRSSPSRSRRCRDRSMDSLSSAEEKKASPSESRRGRRRSLNNNTHTLNHTLNNTLNHSPPKLLTAAAEEHKTTRAPRMARLASIFATRGQTSKSSPPKQPKSSITKAAALQAGKTPAPPPAVLQPSSPSRSQVSTSSSGFVAWPGTQDKRGKTVAMESSYDDSSVGAAAFHAKKLEDDSESLEHRKWPDEQSIGNSSAGKSLLVPLENEDHSDSEGSVAESAADFHLKAILEDAKKFTPATNPRSHQVLLKNDKVKNNAHALQPPANISSNRFKARQISIASSRSQVGSAAGTSVSGTLSIYNLFPSDPPAALPTPSLFEEDPWDVDTSSHPPSSPGTSVSKDSSAFFHTGNTPLGDPKYGVRPNLKGAASIIRRRQMDPQPPTEEALKVQNHLVPPVRSFNSQNVRGFRGYLDKTKDVPNLMDDEMDSDSIASSRATSASDAHQLPPPRSRLNAHVAKTRNLVQKQRRNDPDEESDVFDGLSFSGRGMVPPASPSPIEPAGGDADSMQVVMLGGGLAAIQTTQEDFDQRKMASDYDDNLTNSEVDQYGFAKTPGFNEMMSAGRSPVDSSTYIEPHANDGGAGHPPIRHVIRKQDPPSRALVLHQPGGVHDNNHYYYGDAGDGVSDIYEGTSVALVPFRGSLRRYRVHPSTSKKLVGSFRNLSRAGSVITDLTDFQKKEDAKKAFALSEMRSRIMEKDLERGLERQGGSMTVDDIILTPYYQAAYRVRDAVIVSKAWRDGASPSDVVTANLMTRRAERTHRVKRPVKARASRPPLRDNSSGGYPHATRTFAYEAVAWLDDTDFAQMRCPSLGPRFMRGFEIFTIGDCQSILLKLTNERCGQLRNELHGATTRQIDAEDMMKEDGDPGDGMMTESEMMYLAAMEDVKTISRQLVIAEKSFALVRDRIEKLVARYEAMLVKIENESIATASVITFDDSSYYSDDYDSEYSSEGEEDEKDLFQRRARRAELRAELAAREALMAKQAAKKIQVDKQREIEILQQKLNDLQSESSYAITEREQSIVLAKAIAQKHGVGDRGSHHGSKATSIDDDRINGVKQKFRDRMAQRLQARSGAPGNVVPRSGSESGASSSIQPYRPHRNATQPRSRMSAKSQRRMLVGEEMYQHLDFYERSLKAVDSRV